MPERSQIAPVNQLYLKRLERLLPRLAAIPPSSPEARTLNRAVADTYFSLRDAGLSSEAGKLLAEYRMYLTGSRSPVSNTEPHKEPVEKTQDEASQPGITRVASLPNGMLIERGSDSTERKILQPGFFLRRMETALRKERQPNLTKSERRLAQHVAYSSYLDAVSEGIGNQARELLEQQRNHTQQNPSEEEIQIEFELNRLRRIVSIRYVSVSLDQPYQRLADQAIKSLSDTLCALGAGDKAREVIEEAKRNRRLPHQGTIFPS